MTDTTAAGLCVTCMQHWGAEAKLATAERLLADATAALEVMLMACPVREGGSAHRQATEALSRLKQHETEKSQ